jgi:hypothetical protein
MSEIRFLTNEAGKVEGLAYAGFETFKGSPYTSCARETGQNSRDAAVTHPVTVSFNLLTLARSDIPFADQLQHSIKCCLANPHDAKTKQHLERAYKSISASEIKVLEISDRNTTGLTGPTTDARSVFTALVKGDGVTKKEDMTSAGSFGIGKNAAFAVSDLQTVIYSTRYLDLSAGAVERFAAQGRLRLISHIDGPKKLSAEGYWGGPDFTAIEDVTAVPAWLKRHQIGTSIFSIGFREEPHWVERMTLSLATNFFLAIDRGEIEFTVGKGVINSASLASILGSTELESVATQADQLEELRRARRLLECIRSEAASTHKILVPDLGEFTLHLLVKDDMPREVHVLRNGIYISDNFAKFSEPMRRFPGVREFTAVLEPSPTPAGKLPSTLLKQLENPAHDAFEPERIIEEVERQKAKKQIKHLIKRVREVIRELAKMEELDTSQLDELSHLFGASGSGTKTNEEEDPAKFTYGEARRGRRARPPGAERGKGGKGGGGGQRVRERSATKTRAAHPAAVIKSFRSTLPDATNLRRRAIFFTPDFSGDVQFAVSAVGLSGDVELRVVTSSLGTTSGGRVSVPVTKGVRVALDLTLADPFRGPIELTVASAKSKEAA